MPTRDELLAQIDRIRDQALLRSLDFQKSADAMIERVEDQIAILDRFPEDDFVDGNVITFTYKFNNDQFAREYNYACIKHGGLWYSTGPRAPKGYTWDKLCEWWNNGVLVELNWVTEIEKLY